VDKSEKSRRHLASTPERLRWVRENIFGRRSKTAFARKLGMTLMQYDYYERRAALPLESLPRVMELTRVHPKWLYSGAGEPFLPEGVQFPEGRKAIDLINELVEREAGRDAAGGNRPGRARKIVAGTCGSWRRRPPPDMTGSPTTRSTRPAGRNFRTTCT